MGDYALLALAINLSKKKMPDVDRAALKYLVSVVPGPAPNAPPHEFFHQFTRIDQWDNKDATWNSILFHGDSAYNQGATLTPRADFNEDKTWEDDVVEFSVYAQARAGSSYGLLLDWLEPFLGKGYGEMVGYLRPNDQFAHSYLIYTDRYKFRLFRAIPPKLDYNGFEDPTVKGEIEEIDWRKTI